MPRKGIKLGGFDPERMDYEARLHREQFDHVDPPLRSIFSQVRWNGARELLPNECLRPGMRNEDVQ